MQHKGNSNTDLNSKNWLKRANFKKDDKKAIGVINLRSGFITSNNIEKSAYVNSINNYNHTLDKEGLGNAGINCSENNANSHLVSNILGTGKDFDLLYNFLSSKFLGFQGKTKTGVAT